MKTASLPFDERLRMETLSKYNILDSEQESAFDSIVNLASYICQTPIAAISLIDNDRQWFKAITGLDVKETSREVAFCAHTILQDETLVVPDASMDERFFDNPLVTSNPKIRFYAGVPLTAPNGQHLGTLCVIDHVARELNQDQLNAINILARNIMAHLNLRLLYKRTSQYMNELQVTASVFDDSNDPMILTDANNNILKVNPAFTATTGYTLDEVQGRNPKILSSGHTSKEFYRKMWEEINNTGQWNGELINKRKNGVEYTGQLSVSTIFNPDRSKRLHVAIYSDFAKRNKDDELIWNQANLDFLTQLPNRRLFHDRLEQEIKVTNRTCLSTALLFIDLDYFKKVNDILGHDIGDELLIQVARRIQRNVRKADTVARIGGDEFTVILSQIANARDATVVAEKVIQELELPFIINGQEIRISASIGVSIYPNDGDSVKSLLKKSDIAMYEAKKNGRGKINHYRAK